MTDAEAEGVRNNVAESAAMIALMRALGGKWKLEILWALTAQKKGFNQLRREIPGISQNVLSSQLRQLEDCWFLTRTVIPTTPPRVEYELTDAATDLSDILEAFRAWRRKHHNAAAALENKWSRHDNEVAAGTIDV